jgi:hypothetical protein
LGANGSYLATWETRVGGQFQLEIWNPISTKKKKLSVVALVCHPSCGRKGKQPGQKARPDLKK